MMRWLHLACLSVVVAAAGLSFSSAFSPIIGEHDFRQAMTYSVARNFHEVSGDFFHPRLDWNDGRTGIMAMEAPIYPYLSHLAFYLLGERPQTARLVTWMFFVVAIAAFAALARAARGVSLAAAVCLVFVLSPLLLFEGRQIQPDVPMLALVVVAAWLFFRHSLHERWRDYGLGLGAFSLATLTKPPAILLVPSMWLFAIAARPVGRKRALFRGVGFLLPVALTVAWWRWGQHLSATYNEGHSEFVMMESWATIHSTLTDVASQRFVFAFLLPAYAIQWCLLPAVVAGAALGLRPENRRLSLAFTAWLGGGLALCAAFASHSRNHWYDAALLVPPAAWFGGLGIEQVFELTRPDAAPARATRWSAIVIVGSFALAPLVGSWETGTHVVAASGPVAGATWLSLRGACELLALAGVAAALASFLHGWHPRWFGIGVACAGVLLLARSGYEDFQVFAWRARLREARTYEADWGGLNRAVDCYAGSDELVATDGSSPWYLHLTGHRGFADTPDRVRQRGLAFYQQRGVRLFAHFSRAGTAAGLPPPLAKAMLWSVHCIAPDGCALHCDTNQRPR